MRTGEVELMMTFYARLTRFAHRAEVFIIPLWHPSQLSLHTTRNDRGGIEIEIQYNQRLAHFLKEETGYQQIQGTKPQTLAFGPDGPVSRHGSLKNSYMV